MTIDDPDLLKQFRTAGPCEVCGQWCRRREAAHLWSVGSGRLDIRINLVACGRTKDFHRCHLANHSKTEGRVVSREDLLVIVAKRENLGVEAIVAEIHRLRRLPQPKDGKKKHRTTWQERANEYRRAWRRKMYRLAKELRKQRAIPGPRRP